MSNRPLSAKDQAVVDHSRKLEQLREAFEQRFKLDIWPVYKWLKNNGGFPPTQPAGGEPVYQVMYLGLDGGGWVDVDRETMERNGTAPKHFNTRTLWTTPPAAAHGASEEHRNQMADTIVSLRTEIAALRRNAAAHGDDAMDELRRSAAEILGQDPDTWPSHGNAPLAIASALALATMRARGDGEVQ